MNKGKSKTDVLQVEPGGSFLLPKTPKKVAIVGFASSWHLAPWEDESFEIWGLNELYKLAKAVPFNTRFERWFEIHSPESPSKNNKEHQDFLRTCNIPLYMQKHYPEFPTSIEYPREQIKNYFNQNMVYSGNPFLPKELNDIEKKTILNGSKFTNFSNQISWMTALAIMEGFDEIHIYGVDMATKEKIQTPGDKEITVIGEYVWQRPSVEFFIGFALGKGIKFLIPQNSELAKFPQDYGFDTDNQVRLFLRQRKKDLTGRLNAMIQKRQKNEHEIMNLNVQINQLQGAIGEIGYQLGNHIV